MRKSRLNVSWLGTPFSSLRNPRRNGSLDFAKRPMSTEPCPPHRTAHGYHQNLMKVVQRRIASARVVQTVPAFDKAIQNILPRRESSATRQNPSHPKRKTQP